LAIYKLCSFLFPLRISSEWRKQHSPTNVEFAKITS